MKSPCLQVRDARFAYPGSEWTLAVEEFSLWAGEMVSVIGPNGSGKSTLLRLLAGIQRVQQGEVHLEGRPVREMERREIARVLGYLPQDSPCEFNYRAWEVVAMGRYAHLGRSGFLSKRDHAVIQNGMERTDTWRMADRRIFTLSGGERQRVFLASVLAQEPAILLLDEPTSALDLHHQVRFLEILRDLSGREITVVAVTHDINLASIFCERMVLMNQGRIVKEGDPEEVLQQEELREVYGEEIVLARHPENGRPMVFLSYRK